VYDLTPGGEAAFEALATLDEALRRVGGLQAVALRQIEEMLGQLVTALRATMQDAERVFALCEDLHTRFKGLTANASLSMQKVNRLLAAPVLDARDFALFKADTITYLNDFIADLDILAVRIRQRLDDLDQVDPVTVTAALAAAEGVSGQIPLDGDADALTWARQAQIHLTGLEKWFRADVGARAGAAALHEKTRAAVLGIARAAERIRESSTSPSSRSADLLALAVRFEEAGGDEEAHRLWHSAFGLAPARHLGGIPDDDGVPAAASLVGAACRCHGLAPAPGRGPHRLRPPGQERHGPVGGQAGPRGQGPRGIGEGRPGGGDADRARSRRPQLGQWPTWRAS
jgi:uncharacterized protein (TIGR02677 family)